MNTIRYISILLLLLLHLGAGVYAAEDTSIDNSLSSPVILNTTDPAIIGSLIPEKAEQGFPFSGSIGVTNTGPESAPGISIVFYLIKENQTGSSPIWIHQKTTEQIPAIYRDTVPFATNIPGGIEPGEYRLLSTINTTGVDRNPDNNQYISDQKIIITPSSSASLSGMPDLSVDLRSVSTNESASGYPLTINYTAKNLGNQSAGTYHIGFYLSPDPVIEPSDLKIWDEIYFNAYEGMAEPGSATDLIPSGIIPGDYYLGAIIDFTSMVQESDEENNVAGTAIPFRITSQEKPVTNEFLGKVAGLIALKTNLYRQYRGLSDLDYDMKLGDIARLHSADMAERKYFSHISPEGIDPTLRATGAGFKVTRAMSDGTIRTGIAENIVKISGGHIIGEGFSGFLDPSDAQAIADVMMIEWISSPEHDENLQNPTISSIGVGLAYDGEYFYATQNFF